MPILFETLDELAVASAQEAADAPRPKSAAQLPKQTAQTALPLTGDWGAWGTLATAEHFRDLVPVLVARDCEKSQKAETEYLYQGISARPFRRTFNLADYVQVKGASFEDGLLKIDLVREVPEAMKPRRIAINGNNVQTIDQKKAA